MGRQASLEPRAKHEGVHVRIDGLTKSFGAFKALENVSLELAPGSIVALLGPNGAGKTTLLRCLAGIIAPQRGTISYDGDVFKRSKIELRRRFCFLPDFPFAFPHMSVLAHIAMLLKLYEVSGPEVEERVVEAMRDLDLLPLADLQIGHLSRGQAYKAAMASLFAVDPELWMLDEPFASGMDPHGINVFRSRCRLATERGRIILYSTQILDIAKEFCDRVGIIHRGQIVMFEREQLRAEKSDFLNEVFRQLSEDV
jgi:ABC-type multidrug transport system ATPase subunit